MQFDDELLEDELDIDLPQHYCDFMESCLESSTALKRLSCKLEFDAAEIAAMNQDAGMCEFARQCLFIGSDGVNSYAILRDESVEHVLFFDYDKSKFYKVADSLS